MNAIDTVRTAADRAKIPTTHIGIKLGKSRAYFSMCAKKGRDPQSQTLADMLDVCGYVLCAVPKNRIPKNALVIDPKPKEDSDE